MNAIQSICKYKSIKILKTLLVIKKSQPLAVEDILY